MESDVSHTATAQNLRQRSLTAALAKGFGTRQEQRTGHIEQPEQRNGAVQVSDFHECASLAPPIDALRGAEQFAQFPENAELRPGQFLPRVPKSLHEAGLRERHVEALILRFLFHGGSATGREIADQLALPFRLVEPLLHRLKADHLVVFRATALAGDYVYQLTEAGLERARLYLRESSYFGAAPVPIEDYIASVAVQSVARQHIRLSDLRRAFADLVLGPELLNQLGEAINGGLGFFLFGAPGNGKTSIAERVTKVFGESIWIPRSILACGETIRLFDASCHEALPLEASDSYIDERDTDRRWVRIRRPTIVVGGELTLDHLEISTNAATGLREAPLQLKSNGGTLVIDDFGRQRVSPNEILNRWVMPLEKRFDLLNSASGRKIEVPFDQLIIFSTNLEPKSLVDEAFLRRIPYKIDVCDPSPNEFCEVFMRTASDMNIDCCEATVNYLLSKHYTAHGRSLRYCHPRDLLRQVYNYCRFRNIPLAVTQQSIDTAVKNYFAIV
jgi:predicted ATPase with chaperone activity